MAIRVFIDQGHNPGNINPGAEGNGLTEQEVTYKVGIYLADILRKDPRFEVRVSRKTPSAVVGTSTASSLTQRVYMANSWPANYFISIHCNAFSNPSANGTEALVYAQYTQGYWLGEHILKSIVSRMGTQNRGVRIRPDIYVLRKTKMPAVLIELAFITNESDAALLRDNPYGFAYAIYEGMLGYFDFQPI
ncbi:MAG: N-acetylmuramoyl-L-alanine amidase [Oscillospiraceae bacterium]|nr:N-acetylmuramoyl-L-alanine amidase [Oscillospiraceae bacterium]